jgi:hypothetical protein
MMPDPVVDKEVEIANRESIKIHDQVSTIKIRKDYDQTVATKLVADIKRLYKNIDGQRKSITQPLRVAIKNTDELFKDPLTRLKDAETIIKAEMLRYNEMVERRAANRADKIEGQVDAGEMGLAEGIGKLNSIKQADKNVKSDSGSAQFKTLTKIRITDPAQLPAKYFMRPRVIEALRLEVSEDVLKNAEPVPAGAETYEDRQVAVRV